MNHICAAAAVSGNDWTFDEENKEKKKKKKWRKEKSDPALVVQVIGSREDRC